MRIAVISSAFPCGTREAYLGAELEALRAHLGYAAVAPLRPDRTHAMEVGATTVLVQHPTAPSTYLLAFEALVRAPAHTLAALYEVLTAPRTLRAKLKNLAIFPRALALARRFAREGVDHVHAYWLSAPATAALVVSRVNDVPWSATAHRWDIFEDNMVAQKVADARFVRTISERGRAALARMVPGQEKKIEVVRLGSALTAQAAARPRRDTTNLLCAAAFVSTKGHADLLDAFARAHAADSSLHLTLAGSGPLLMAMRARVEKMACRAAVSFRGHVEHCVLLRELTLGHYDAVILASHDDGVREMEGVPSILIEASSLGVACIATLSGAVGELLDERSAFLAAPQNAPALARAILDATEPGERDARARRAADRTRRLHDPSRTAATIAGLIAGAQGGAA